MNFDQGSREYYLLCICLLAAVDAGIASLTPLNVLAGFPGIVPWILMKANALTYMKYISLIYGLSAGFLIYLIYQESQAAAPAAKPAAKK